MELTVDTLKKICENLPGEYSVKIISDNGYVSLSDTFEVDVSNEVLILKK